MILPGFKKRHFGGVFLWGLNSGLTVDFEDYRFGGLFSGKVRKRIIMKLIAKSERLKPCSETRGKS